MPPEGPRYAAFLSYSHQDQKWARWVHGRLERYRVPGRLRREAPARAIPQRLRPVFRDREELPSAGNLGDKIMQALAQSRALVVICSPAAARSRWVNEEILNFKRLHGGQSVYCLIVAGERGEGNLRGAADNSSEARALYATMLQAEPDNMLRREQLATSLRGEGNTLHLLGQHELARERMAGALEHMTTLTQFDPSNRLWAVWEQASGLVARLDATAYRVAAYRNECREVSLCQAADEFQESDP